MGKYLEISVLNRRVQNCLELPGLPLFGPWRWPGLYFLEYSFSIMDW